MNRHIKPIIALVVLVVLGAAILSISRGPNSEGTLNLTVPIASSSIFINTQDVTTTTIPDQTLIRPLGTGNRSIIVSAQGYYPWQKSIVITKNATTSAHALEIPEHPTLAPLSGSAYAQAEAAVTDQAAHNTVISPSGDVTLHISGGTIAAQWNGTAGLPYFFCTTQGCAASTTVFASSLYHITNATFFPDRDDAIVFAIGKSVFVREIDARPTQNTYPIYSGTAPKVALINNSIIIKDGANIMSFRP